MQKTNLSVLHHVCYQISKIAIWQDVIPAPTIFESFVKYMFVYAGASFLNFFLDSDHLRRAPVDLWRYNGKLLHEWLTIDWLRNQILKNILEMKIPQKYRKNLKCLGEHREPLVY